MAVNVLDYVGIGIDPKTGARHEIKYLPETAEWETSIYQMEQRDKLIGGVDGIDNVQAQMLANRTKYLKEMAESQGEEIERIKQEGMGGTKVIVMDISIPAEGWQEGSGDYPFHRDIPEEGITEDMIPMVIISPDSIGDAEACGLCPACETIEGNIRVYAKTVPGTAIDANLTLFLSRGGGGDVDLPIATKSALGAVKIGEGLDIKGDGTLSVKLEDEDNNGVPDEVDAAMATPEDIADLLQEIYPEQRTEN